MILVLDASVVLEILLRTAAGIRLSPRVLSEASRACCPHLLDLEVAQVLRRYAREGRVGERRAREALEDLSALPLTRYPHEPLLERVWELRHNLTAYDAAYLALAEALAARLLTRDERLATSPVADPIVELV